MLSTPDAAPLSVLLKDQQALLRCTMPRQLLTLASSIATKACKALVTDVALQLLKAGWVFGPREGNCSITASP